MWSVISTGISAFANLVKRFCSPVFAAATLFFAPAAHASMDEFTWCNYWTAVPDRITFKRAPDPLTLSTYRVEAFHSGSVVKKYKNLEEYVGAGALHARNCTYGFSSYPGNSKMILNFKFRGTNVFGTTAGAAAVADHFVILARGKVNRTYNTGGGTQVGRGFAIFPPTGAYAPTVGNRGAFIQTWNAGITATSNIMPIEDNKWYRVEMWVYLDSMNWTIYDDAQYPTVYMNGNAPDHWGHVLAAANEGYGFALLCNDAGQSCEGVGAFELEIKDISYGWGY